MRKGIWPIIAGCLLGIASNVAAADDNSSICPAILVDVGFGSFEDRTLVCDGAASARAFLRSHKIEVRRRIKLRLHHTPLAEGGNHIGAYDGRKDQIDLLTFKQAKAQISERSLFRMQMDEPLYISIVVHEVAHAIAGQNLEIRPDSLIVHEYIAYVAQLSTMEPHRRSEILRRYDVAAFAGIEEMSSIYYELDPSGFGVKAFRHFQSLSEPSEFLHGLLSGSVRPVASDMEWQ